MAKLYTAKPDVLLDELAAAELSTASDLAIAAGISRNTASSVLNGKPVSLQTVLAVVRALRNYGGDSTASTVFGDVQA